MLIKQSVSWMWQVLSTLLTPVSFHLASARSFNSKLPLLAPSNGTCQSSISRFSSIYGFDRGSRLWLSLARLIIKLIDEESCERKMQAGNFVSSTDIRNVEFITEWRPPSEMDFVICPPYCSCRYKNTLNIYVYYKHLQKLRQPFN